MLRRNCARNSSSTTSPQPNRVPSSFPYRRLLSFFLLLNKIIIIIIMTDLILFNIEFYRIDEIDEWIKMKWVWIDWNATNEQPIFFYIIVDWLIIILISQFMNLWYLSTCKIKWFSSNLKSDFILHWFWWIQMKEKKTTVDIDVMNWLTDLCRPKTDRRRPWISPDCWPLWNRWASPTTTVDVSGPFWPPFTIWVSPEPSAVCPISPT